MKIENIFSSKDGALVEMEYLMGGNAVTKEFFFEQLDDRQLDRMHRRFIGEMNRQRVFEIDKLFTEKSSPMREYVAISTSSTTFFVGTNYDGERNNECRISINGKYCLSIFSRSTIKAMG